MTPLQTLLNFREQLNEGHIVPPPKYAVRPVGRPSFTFPENIDWGLPYVAIAQQLGTNPGTVRNEFIRRFPNAGRKTIRIRPESEKWACQRAKEWDWTKRDTELAKTHGLSRERVRQIRKGLGLPPSVRCYPWDKVDWSQSNRRIVNETGISHMTVAKNRRKYAPESIVTTEQLRAKYFALCDAIPREAWMKQTAPALKAMLPGVPYHQLARYKLERALRKPSRWTSAERYGKIDWTQTNAEIAKIVGIKRGSVSAYRNAHGFPVSPRDNPSRTHNGRMMDVYKDTDWSKSNAELAAIYGITPRSFANVRTWFRKRGIAVNNRFSKLKTTSTP